MKMLLIYYNMNTPVTYDHRLQKTGHPVRSAIHKLEIGGLVVGWVTTSESPLLYVFVPFWSQQPLFFLLLFSMQAIHPVISSIQYEQNSEERKALVA